MPPHQLNFTLILLYCKTKEVEETSMRQQSKTLLIYYTISNNGLQPTLLSLYYCNNIAITIPIYYIFDYYEWLITFIGLEKCAHT